MNKEPDEFNGNGLYITFAIFYTIPGILMWITNYHSWHYIAKMITTIAMFGFMYTYIRRLSYLNHHFIFKIFYFCIGNLLPIIVILLEATIFKLKK